MAWLECCAKRMRGPMRTSLSLRTSTLPLRTSTMTTALRIVRTAKEAASIVRTWDGAHVFPGGCLMS